MDDIIVRRSMQNSNDNLKWLNPRLCYLKTFITKSPSKCPECETSLEHTLSEVYCPRCGLVTSTTIEYVGGVRISLPYGRMI